MLEMLIALTVVAILASLAVPNMSDFAIKHKLIGAAEQVYGHIQQARSDAIASSAITYVNFATTALTPTTWQYGVSTTNNCNLALTDATAANACVIVVNDGDTTIDGVNGGVDTDDRILMRFTNTDFTGTNAVAMAISGLGGGTQFIFDPVRGTLGTADGQVDLTSTTGLQLRVRASALGRISICSPGGSVANYEVCP